jgi:hypothetical protein
MSPGEAQPILGVFIGLGLVLGSQVVSFVLGLVVGGFKIGSLERTVEVEVGSQWLPSFLDTMRARLAELHFVATGDEWTLEQSGATFGDLVSFTHAKTRKRLQIRLDDSVEPVRVTLTLAYLDPIVGDTGESAYRDAVLDYVSERANEMPVVPNRSNLAFTALWGSLLTLLATVAMLRLELSVATMAPAVGVPVFVNAGAAVIALVPILRNPGQITGAREAIAAIVASAAAAGIVAAVYLLA